METLYGQRYREDTANIGKDIMAVNLKAKLRLYLFIVFLLIGIAGAAFFVRLKLQKTTVPAKTAQQDVNPENKKANRLNNNPPPSIAGS